MESVDKPPTKPVEELSVEEHPQIESAEEPKDVEEPPAKSVEEPPAESVEEPQVRPKGGENQPPNDQLATASKGSYRASKAAAADNGASKDTGEGDDLVLRPPKPPPPPSATVPSTVPRIEPTETASPTSPQTVPAAAGDDMLRATGRPQGDLAPREQPVS